MNTIETKTKDLTIKLLDDSAEINGEAFRLFPPIEAFIAHFGSPSGSPSLEPPYIWNWPTLGLCAASSDPRYVERLHIMMAPSQSESANGWEAFRGTLVVGGVSRYPGQSGDSFCDTIRRNKTGLPLAPASESHGTFANYETSPNPKKHSVCRIACELNLRPPESSGSVFDRIVFHFANPSLPLPPSKLPATAPHPTNQRMPSGDASSPIYVDRTVRSVTRDETVRVFVRWFWRTGWKIAFFVVVIILFLCLWAYLFHK
jgi:hypothetical protein